MWKLKTDFSFLVTKIQTVLFSDRFQTERKSAINIYLSIFQVKSKESFAFENCPEQKDETKAKGTHNNAE